MLIQPITVAVVNEIAPTIAAGDPIALPALGLSKKLGFQKQL